MTARYEPFRSRSGLDDLEPAAHPALAPPGPPRLAGRRAGRAARGVAPHDPARRRAAARARLSGRVAHRAGRRLSAGGRDGDAAAAARRRRGDRDRGRPADGGAGVGDRDRGDRRAGAGQARAGAARAPAAARAGARRGHHRAPRPGPDRRPAMPHRARHRVPRPRVRALRLRGARRHRRPAGRRAARAGQPRAPLVPRVLGPRPERLADVPGRPDRRAGPARRPVHAPPAAGRGPGRVRRAALRGAAEPLRGPDHAARAGRVDPRFAAVGHGRRRSTTTRCEYRTGDDDLAWLAVRVAMLGVDFEVHEPPELVEQLRVLARRFESGAQAGL